MDWARAKSVILFLLIVFNIFLLTNIIGYARDQGIPASTIANTKAILKMRGITLDCDIPRNNGDVPKLNLNSSVPDGSRFAAGLLGDGYTGSGSGNTYIKGSKKLTIDGDGKLTYTDESPAGTLDTTRVKTVDKFVRDFLTDIGLIDGSYVLDETQNGVGGIVGLTYLEKYKGYLIYDNYVKVSVSAKGITGLTWQRKSIAGLSADRVTNMADAYQVLLANFDGSNHATITGMDLGYTFEFTQDTTSVRSEQSPAWRVKLEALPEPLYFSAVDGKPVK